MTLEEHTREGNTLAINGVLVSVLTGFAAVLACIDVIPWLAALFGFSSGLFAGLGAMAWAKVRAWERALSPTDSTSPTPKGQDTQKEPS